MSIPHIRLSQVLTKVKSAIAAIGGAGGIWVVAEVLKISNGTHRYLELVEYDEQRKEVAKSQGMIWRDRVSMLAAFRQATGLDVGPGMKILFRAKPVFHEVYGLTLELIELDSNYTLGDMESKIKMIREYLREKNWYTLNRALPTPCDFTRVAVISPADAAGLGDFRVEADILQQHGVCEFVYYPAMFQGPKCSDSIVEQMIKVHGDMHNQAFDCLIIIRGGGDKAGLYQLNDRRLAASVCRFPIPVLVGIGHERDKVFLEEVAGQRFATPSLLISHIKQQIVGNARQALAHYDQVISLAHMRLEQIEKRAEGLYFNLREASLDRLNAFEREAARQQGLIREHANALLEKVVMQAERMKTQMNNAAHSQLQGIEHEANLLISTVMAANPLAILGKGYAYVQSQGKIVTRSDQIMSGERISTYLQSFTIHSIVESTDVQPSH
jgi:exodeoxyribonuclease VII large subunit